MKHIHLSIDQRVLALLPDLELGVVVVEDLDNKDSAVEVVQEIRTEEKRIAAKYSRETLASEPLIACWREVYRKFGAKPKENQSSVEALYRSVLNGRELRQINTLVDIYNLISLKHLVPVGGEDLDRIEGNVSLTRAGENEPEVQLLGDREPRQPKPGEVIYRDNIGTICRRLNWREANRTKLTPNSKRALLVIEKVPPISIERCAAALAELEALVKTYCNAKSVRFILNKSNPRITIKS